MNSRQRSVCKHRIMYPTETCTSTSRCPYSNGGVDTPRWLVSATRSRMDGGGARGSPGKEWQGKRKKQKYEWKRMWLAQRPASTSPQISFKGVTWGPWYLMVAARTYAECAGKVIRGWSIADTKIYRDNLTTGVFYGSEDSAGHSRSGINAAAAKNRDRYKKRFLTPTNNT